MRCVYLQFCNSLIFVEQDCAATAAAEGGWTVPAVVATSLLNVTGAVQLSCLTTCAFDVTLSRMLRGAAGLIGARDTIEKLLASPSVQDWMDGLGTTAVGALAAAQTAFGGGSSLLPFSPVPSSVGAALVQTYVDGGLQVRPRA